MKSAAPRSTAYKADSPAVGQGMSMVDNRAVAVAQRQMNVAIDNSPQQVAQRQQAEVAAPRKNTTGLPDSLRAGMENLSGHSLDDVQVHYNSAKPAQLQAHAYAQGTDIHIGPGQDEHLPHETWHVVQQKQGRVRATSQVNGVPVNNHPALENEATAMGNKAIAVPKSSPAPMFQANTPSSQPTVQRMLRRAVMGAGATYGAFVANNVRQQGPAIADPQSAGTGRLRAVAETARHAPGSVGAVMRPPVRVAHALLGDVASGSIGGHYAHDIPDAMSRPATNENIRTVADRETDFWNAQPGAPGVLGSSVSANGRDRMLRVSRYMQAS